MERALELAEEAAGGLSPRPPVGAVIVGTDGKTIVGEGATQPNPGPHAEVVAISRAGSAARGGTIYCTLEPHQNQLTTPPCTSAIIDAGIKRVVCPTIDPNPMVDGRGFQYLRDAGIEVITEIDERLTRRSSELIEGFAKHIRTGLPFVTAKWAMSLDGKIATRCRDSKWITGEAARAHAHTIRYRSDAVITGIETVLADNPRLTARHPKTQVRMGGRPYLRIVVDSESRMPDDAALLEEDGEVLQAVAKAAIPSSSRNVMLIPNENGETVDLAALIQRLGERGCTNVLVEAGEKLTGALFDLKLVDKVVVYLATSRVIGGSEALSPVGGNGPATIGTSAKIENTRVEALGEDMVILGYVKYAEETE